MLLDESNQAEFDELHTQIHDAIHADHEVRWMQTDCHYSDSGVS